LSCIIVIATVKTKTTVFLQNTKEKVGGVWIVLTKVSEVQGKVAVLIMHMTQ